MPAMTVVHGNRPAWALVRARSEKSEEMSATECILIRRGGSEIKECVYEEIRSWEGSEEGKEGKKEAQVAKL